LSGVKGRSGGWNRRSVADHILAGTYRRDRHGTRPAALAVVQDAPPPPPPPWLSEWGKGQWTAITGEYIGLEDPVAAVLFERAVGALDQAEQCRRRVAADDLLLTGPRGASRSHPLLAVQQAREAFAAAIFKQLGIGTITP
jgi:hypothetical protein